MQARAFDDVAIRLAISAADLGFLRGGHQEFFPTGAAGRVAVIVGM